MTPHIEHHAGRDGDAKSPGQIAYEAEIAERPRYLTGAKRPSWSELKQKHRDAWERNALDAQLKAQGVIR